MKKKSYHVYFIVIVFLQLLMTLFFMNIKKGYFVDELWSYTFANGYKEPNLYIMKSDNNGFDLNDTFFNRWVDGIRYHKSITVQASETFSYTSVINNHVNDINPPLFCCILHSICSFFPDTFSPWFGYFINLVCFVFIQKLIYVISFSVVGDKKCSLLPVLFYGFTICSVNTCVYIRMYSFSTFLYLLSLFLHVKLVKDTKNSTLFGIFLTIFIAGFNHYYFFVYQFFLSVITCLYYCWTDKSMYKFWQYGLTAFFAVVSFFAVYPIAYRQLFFSTRGQEAFSCVSDIVFPFNIDFFLYFFVRYCLGFTYKFANALYDYLSICIVLVGLIYWYLLRKSERIKGLWRNNNKYFWIYFLLPCLGYIYLITPLSLKSGLLAARYYFPLFPIFAILICNNLYYLIRLFIRKKYSMLLTVVFILLFSCCSLANNIHEFTLEGSFEVNREKLKSLLNKTNVIAVIFEDQYIHSFIDLFTDCKSVLATRNAPKDIELLKNNLKVIKESETKTYLIVLAKENIVNLSDSIISSGFSIRHVFNFMNHIKVYSLYELNYKS